MINFFNKYLKKINKLNKKLMSSTSFSFNQNNINLSALKETFTNLKEDEASPKNPSEYLISIDGARASMVDWLSFLCSKLNFTDQTLFRSVSIFDEYISNLTIDDSSMINQQYLNLIAIACLSLASKLEEINCNYISFLNEKVLNTPNEKIFTNTDLTNMEIQILKSLQYNTMISTPLDFIEIYLDIFKNFLGTNNIMINSQLISDIYTLAINFTKNNLNNVIYLLNSSSHMAYLCFVQALNQVSMMNSFHFKQLQKSIFTFNVQFSNII
jgi:hypothetical protein